MLARDLQMPLPIRDRLAATPDRLAVIQVRLVETLVRLGVIVDPSVAMQVRQEEMRVALVAMRVDLILVEPCLKF